MIYIEYVQGSQWSGKVSEKNIFLRSVKSQWVFWEVSEKLDLPKSPWEISEFETDLVLAILTFLWIHINAWYQWFS